VIADIDEAGGRSVAGAIGGSFVALDVTDDAAWLELEALVKREHGGLDVAVLAPGITGSFALLPQASLSDWRKVMAVNLDGTMLGIRTALRLMEGRGGSVVTVASTSGMRAVRGLGAYSASKGGVRLLTRVAALEGAGMKPAVRVNCILPSPIEIPLLDRLLHTAPVASPASIKEFMLAFVPLQRFGRTDEFGAVACFLASDASSYMTGVDVPLDGGLTAG
jgi:NAD(P)-dependent dehydrogenase (short-subunit alcohol dehydrogenase family)